MNGKARSGLDGMLMMVGVGLFFALILAGLGLADYLMGLAPAPAAIEEACWEMVFEPFHGGAQDWTGKNPETALEVYRDCVKDATARMGAPE